MNVKNKDLVKGKYYLTGDNNADLTKRKFLANHSNNIAAIFEDDNYTNSATSWEVIEEIEEPQHWTLETCPLPPFTVKNKHTRCYRTVTSVGKFGIGFGDKIKTYVELFDDNLYIPDRNNRDIELPCGVVG